MRINLRPVWEKLVPDRWLCFCPIFLSFCWSSLVTFGEFTFQKLVANQLFRLEFCAVRQHTFYTRQVYEQVNLYKTSNLYFIGWSIRNWKIAAYLQYANNWTLQAKFDKIYFLYQHSEPPYDVMQKEIENLEFVREVNFEFFDSLQNNGTKYLLLFDNSCEENATQRPLLTLPPLGDIEVWAQSTWNTTFFTRSN